MTSREMFASLDTQSQVTSIYEEVKAAVEETGRHLASVSGKDIVVLFGVSGAGKTAVACHLLGEKLVMEKDRIEAATRREDLVISRGATSQVVGMAVAKFPKDDVWVMDLAGVDATQGLPKEVANAVLRAGVLKEARSARFAVVMSREKIRGSCGRDAALQDLGDFVRFLDVCSLADTSTKASRHERSVALLLTWLVNGSKPLDDDELLQKLDSIHDDLKELAGAVNATKALDDDDSRCKASGCAQLLGHFAGECGRACEIAERGMADGLFAQLATNGCGVWPVDFLQRASAPSLRQMLLSLPPVAQPSNALRCLLPKKGHDELMSLLCKAAELAGRAIAGKGWVERAEDECLQLLHLAALLADLRILPAGSASAVCDGLLGKLLQQNQQAVDQVEQGVTCGSASRMQRGLQFLKHMDAFRGRLSHLLGDLLTLVGRPEAAWCSYGDAICRGVEAARNALPKDVGSCRWTAETSKQVGCVFSVLPILEPRGEALRTEFVGQLKERIRALVRCAAECRCAVSVADSFRTLEEHRCLNELEVLPTAELDVAAAVEGAKQAVLEQLASLGQQVRQQLVSYGDTVSEGLPDLGRRLRELCNSTEVESLLGRRDLYAECVLKPVLARELPEAAFAELRELLGMDGEDWVEHACALAEEGAGLCRNAESEVQDQLLQMLVSRFDFLHTKVRALALKACGTVKEAVQEIGRVGGAGFAEDCSARAASALALLGRLSVIDQMLKTRQCRLFVRVALKSLQQQLDGALVQANAAVGACTCSGGLDDVALQALHRLRALVAVDVEGALHDWPTCDLAVPLSTVRRKAQAVMEEVATRAMNAWPEGRFAEEGWMDDFQAAFEEAVHLRKIAPAVVDERCRSMQVCLQQRWADLKAAAAKIQDPLDAQSAQQFVDIVISQGLALERHNLSGRIGTAANSKHFSTLLTRKVHELCDGPQQPRDPQRYLQALQKLRAELAVAAVDSATALLARLEDRIRQLSDWASVGEVRFETALSDQLFAEAAEQLPSVGDVDRRREKVKERFRVALVHAKHEVNRNADGCMEMGRRLLGQIEQSEELRTILSPQHAAAEELHQAMAARVQDAEVHLFSALEEGNQAWASEALARLGSCAGSTLGEKVQAALEKYARQKEAGLRDATMPGLVDLLRAAETLDERCAGPAALGSLRELAAKAEAELLGRLNSYQNARSPGGGDGSEHEDLSEAMSKFDELKHKRRKLREAFLQHAVPEQERRLQEVLEQVDSGDFALAMYFMTRFSEGTRGKLAAAIKAKLSTSLGAPTGKESKETLLSRIGLLSAFLTQAGDPPPQCLSMLFREVRQVLQLQQPIAEAQAAMAAEQVRTAADGHDIFSLGKAYKQWASWASLEGLPGAPGHRGTVDPALEAFMEHLVSLVKQVASEIAAGAVQNLSTHPLELNLKKFVRLDPDERKALLERLWEGSSRDAPQDLAAWVRGELAKPVGQLVDHRTLMLLMQNKCFKEVAQRLHVARRVDEILQTGMPSMEPLRVYAEEHQREAVQNLTRQVLPQFDKHYVVLQDLEQHFKDHFPVDLTAVLAKIRTKLNSLLDPLEQRALQAARPQDAVGPLGELRGFADDCASLHELVTERLAVVFQKLKRKFAHRDMAELVMTLSEEHPHIIGEHRSELGPYEGVFFNTMLQLSQLGKLSPEEVVNRLECEPPLGAEGALLVQALWEHKRKIEPLFTRYLNGKTPFVGVCDAARHDLDSAVQQFRSSPSSPALRNVITQLAACYAIVKTGQAYLDAEGASLEDRLQILKRPHDVQMLTLFRLLEAHQSGQASRWQWLWQGLRGLLGPSSSNAGQPKNHMVEILTGEGKSITLGVLATFLGLMGYASDIVCYSEYLSLRDQEDNEALYDFAGVRHLVKHTTFDGLCKSRVERLRSGVRALVEQDRRAAERPQAPAIPAPPRRVMLIDEADVFLSRRFYGSTWNGGVTLTSKEARALVELVFDDPSVHNVEGTPQFQAVVDKYHPELRPALLQAARELVVNVKVFAKTPYFVDHGRIGYKEHDHINFSLVHRNQTVFAYLAALGQKQLTPEEAAPHIGINLLCGHISLAEMPKRYDAILGVTGTLRDLQEEPQTKDILSQDYDIGLSTFAPSVFGSPDLDFIPARDIMYERTQHDWHAKLEREVTAFRGRGHPVLVYFKNEAVLERFTRMECAKLTEQTNNKQKPGIVSGATKPGQVTLLTRALGRGVDFRAQKNQGEAASTVVVIQTFLSSMVSEETQIKGRTARHGQKGRYIQVLCGEHLEAKFGITQAVWEQAVQKLEVAQLLKRKQHEKMRKKAEGRSQRKEAAGSLERQTEAWEKLLSDPSAKEAAKMRELCALNVQHSSIHYTLMLDRSGSMSGASWQQLSAAYARFCQELLASSAANIARMSVVLFDVGASVLEPHHAVATAAPNLADQECSGGTNFAVAFAECRLNMAQSAAGTGEIILFLTDGLAEMPSVEVSALLQEHGQRIRQLTCIGLDTGPASVSVLTAITKAFEDKGIESRIVSANSEETLVNTFVEAASASVMHI